ncbi:MAG: tail fiber domain-containing protein [Flavobacteriales bacterium]
MKKLFFYQIFILVCICSQAQTGRQLVTAHNFNDIAAINAINNPDRGSIVFNLDNSLMYFYNGTSWISLPSSSGGWNINGNIISSSNESLGTTNNQSISFKTNNSTKWTIDSDNSALVPSTTNIVIGTTTYQNTSGYDNVVIGNNTFTSNTNRHSNITIGQSALSSNTTGNNNVAIGQSAFSNNVTGSNNTILGAFSDCTSGIIVSNSSSLGANTLITASNQVRFGSGVTSIGGNSAFNTFSDARFKENLKDNVAGLDFIMGLKPLTYNFNTKKLDLFQRDSTIHSPEHYQNLYDITQIGFLAQDVEALANSLNFDFHGIDKPQNPKDIYGLRYAEFVVPLVKALQEQQGIIEKRQAIIDQRSRRIEVLDATIEELKKKVN